MMPCTEEMFDEAVLEAIAATNHGALEVGDLVLSAESPVCMKIMSIDGKTATVSDSKKEFLVLLTDLAYADAVRVAYLRRMFGDNMIEIKI